MNKLFCLIFYTCRDGDYREGFHIGLFKSREEAKAIELRYRKEVAGFKACDAEITAVPVIGAYTDEAIVYRYVGWNENEDFDEVDLIESACYMDLTEAEADYKKAQSATPRQEWVLNRHTIGQCDWKEGFVRKGGADEKAGKAGCDKTGDP
ncbi:MAG: hypothetical protein IJE22_02185 [Oscillibacter sp.]|nr:hypothetical protein [Oscillibacter sp.]